MHNWWGGKSEKKKKSEEKKSEKQTCTTTKPAFPDFQFFLQLLAKLVFLLFLALLEH